MSRSSFTRWQVTSVVLVALAGFALRSLAAHHAAPTIAATFLQTVLK